MTEMAELLSICRMKYDDHEFYFIGAAKDGVLISCRTPEGKKSKFTYTGDKKEFQEWLESITQLRPKPSSS